MRRINSANAQANKFGPGKNGFQAGNTSTGVPATYFTPEWCDSLQEEIANAIESLGGALDPANNAQLIGVLQANFAMKAALTCEIGKISYVPANVANANHVEAFGTEVNRVGAYADLWAYAQASGMLVTDAVFLSRPGCFGYGSGGVGGTTFRVPKVAGLVIKGYHNGDGTYTTDTTILNGSYVADQLKSHDHLPPGHGGMLLGNVVNGAGFPGATDVSVREGIPPISVGGPENTVRSVILLPQIRYKV